MREENSHGTSEAFIERFCSGLGLNSHKFNFRRRINRSRDKQLSAFPLDIIVARSHMCKMLEDGKNMQSLAVIVLDVFLYNF